MVFHRILCVPLVKENREVRTTKYRCIFQNQIECDITVCGDQRKWNGYDEDEDDVDDEELFTY